MTRPVTLSIIDLNGTSHECVAEAFDTTWNVLILLYAVRALTASTIILPSSFEQHLRDVTRRTAMTDERETMQAIRLAIRQGRLKEPMRGADLDKVLGITWGGNFLAKHLPRHRQFHARFVRVSCGLYRLKD